MKNWTIPLFFGLLMFFLHLLIYAAGIQLSPGELADTDCYMRLIRVEELSQNHDWFDQTIERSNSPFGESSHWGRLLDVLILVIALPFRLFLPEKTSLFCSGVLISPLLLILSGFVLVWAARPLLKNRPAIQLPHLLLLYFSQASVVLLFQAGRSDHHGLLLLLFLASLGYLLRILEAGKEAATTTVLACAAIQALAFSVSLESITIIVLSLSLLALAWIAGHLHSRTGLVFSSALCLFSFLFYLLEQGWSHLGTVELDRMSLPHLMALILAGLYWFIATLPGLFSRTEAGKKAPRSEGPALHPARMAGKIAFCLLYGILSCLLLFNIFPDLLRGPYGQMDPRLNELWLKQVLEVQPLWQTEPGGWTSFSIWFIPALAVFPAALYLGLTRKMPVSYRSWPWLAVLSSSLFFTLLTFYQIRWASYAQIALVFAFTAVLSEVLQITEQKMAHHHFRWTRLAILLFFCAGYVPITALSLGPQFLSSRNEELQAESEGGNDALITLTRWMNKQESFTGRERILAHLDYGPELLYRTGHEVIATPYHRNSSGILFFYDLMNEDSDDAARKRLKERGITLILLKPESSERAFLNQSGKKDTFYQRLTQGTCPGFLQQIELPEESRKAYRLYRVLPD